MVSVGLISPAVSFFKVTGDWILIGYRTTTPSDGGMKTNAALGAIYRFEFNCVEPEWEPPDPQTDPPTEAPPPPDLSIGGYVRAREVVEVGSGNYDSAMAPHDYFDLFADSSSFVPGGPVAGTEYECAWLINLKRYREDNPRLKEIIVELWGEFMPGWIGDTWPTRAQARVYEDIRRTDFDKNAEEVYGAHNITYKGEVVHFKTTRDPQYFGPEDKEVAFAELANCTKFVSTADMSFPDGGEMYHDRGVHFATLTYDMETQTLEIVETP